AAAPIRACANPVPIAPRPTARPAPIAISPSFISVLSVRCPCASRGRALAERPERLSAALVELAEELDVVEAERLDHRAERREREIQDMEEQPDEDPEPDRAENRQRVRDHRQVGGGEADGGETQVREDVPERSDELE